MSSHHLIAELAGRIERAYLRRRPRWQPGCTGVDVWVAAAGNLLEAHLGRACLPLDAELFVASQPESPGRDDPWIELTLAGAARRYEARVRQVVRQLRGEIHAEIRRAERRLSAGAAVETLLLPSNASLSPLGCYIVAHRANRPELADSFRRLAGEQHRSCPLYRQACARVLPESAYPVVREAAAATNPPGQSGRTAAVTGANGSG